MSDEFMYLTEGTEDKAAKDKQCRDICEKWVGRLGTPLDMDALTHLVKASREAQGLRSTYVGQDGRTFDMYHATQEQKTFYDFKYELRAKYPTEADVPTDDMRRFRELRKAAR